MITTDQINRAIAAQPGKMTNVEMLSTVCNNWGFPFFMALAIMEKESRGRNVYGADKGGVLSGFKGDVNKGNYEAFLWLLSQPGSVSNGVGPFQLTYRGYHTDAVTKELQVWMPYDNMTYAIRHILLPTFIKQRVIKSDRAAFAETARSYNAGATGGEAYRDDALVKADAWAAAVGTSDTLVKWSAA